jgi:uncharacterized protein YrrD
MSLNEHSDPGLADNDAGTGNVEPVDQDPADVVRPVGTQGLEAWIGREVLDADGESLGNLAEIYFDVETDEPQFGVVVHGTLIHHRRFVPLAGVVVGPDSIQVGVGGDQVKSAPNADDESALYHHYRLNYVAPDRESGRRLVRH